MNSGDISFPGLGIYLQNVPKTFTVFGFPIALYGVVIAIGMLAGMTLAGRVAKKHGYDPNLVWDFVIYGILFGVIGARIYYVAFSWEYYKDDLLSILNIRNGGLAIYGGVIAAFLTLFVYCKIKKQNYFTMLDLCVPGLALGQAIGRWGNFFNREAFGGYCDNILAMRIPVAAVRAGDISAELAAHMEPSVNYVQVHPTFFYESLSNLFLILCMLWLWKRKKYEGEIGLLYLGGYGFARFWIEGLRTDQLLIPGTGLAVSQVLAALLVVFSVITAIVMGKRKRRGEKSE